MDNNLQNKFQKVQHNQHQMASSQSNPRYYQEPNQPSFNQHDNHPSQHGLSSLYHPQQQQYAPMSNSYQNPPKNGEHPQEYLHNSQEYQQNAHYVGQEHREGEESHAEDRHQFRSNQQVHQEADEEEEEEEGDQEQRQGQRQGQVHDQEEMERHSEGQFSQGDSRQEYEQDNEEEEEEEEDNQEQLECLKCKTVVEEALILKCNHKLCLNCASNQYKRACQNSRNNDSSEDLMQTINCENCGVSTFLPENSIKILLSINTNESNSNYISPSVPSYQVCDSSSTRHPQTHEQNEFLPPHASKQSGKPQKHSKSSAHEETSEDPILYCFSCESECFSLEAYLNGQHKNHNVKNVQKAYEHLQEPIDDLRNKIKTKHELLEQDKMKLDKKQGELINTLETCKAQIKQNFQEIFENLQQKQEKLLADAELCVEEKYEDISKGMDKVMQTMNLLNGFDNDLVNVYYKSDRQLNNDIRAFNYYSINKVKILSTLSNIDTTLFQTIRDKVQCEFYLDTSSLHSHIDSIKAVQAHIIRLKGLENTHISIDRKFNHPHKQEKSKQLLESILQQHSQLTNLSDDNLVNSKYNSIHNNNTIAHIFNGQPSIVPLSELTVQSSPTQPIKIKTNGCLDTSKRYQSPSHALKQTKFSPSNRDNNNLQKSMNSSALHLQNNNGLPGFQSFSINSQSTKQEFNSILSSPSSIAKKYTPHYDKLQAHQKDNPLLKSNLSQTHHQSKVNIFDKLENFKKNIQQSRQHNNAPNSDSEASCKHHKNSQLSQINLQANKSASDRIRQLQEKLHTHHC